MLPSLIPKPVSYTHLDVYKRQLILSSALFGMAVLIGGQLIVEHVFSYVIPISVFITVGGGLYFLYLLLTNRRV